jgi:citrate synthase
MDQPCMPAEEKIQIHRGLKGVYFDRSATSFIDGKAGELRYFGYSIHDLAEHATFEEVCHLLLNGQLPTRNQLETTTIALTSARHLPDNVIAIIKSMQDAHPIDVIRTAVSALEMHDSNRTVQSAPAMRAKALSLTSQLVMIAATHEAIRNGRKLPQPDQNLPHAANLLWMLTGKKPSATAAALMDKDMILHAEHGSNASTFAARVVIGTEASFHAAITSAIAALSGAAHGGAAEDVMRMAIKIGSAEKAASYVANARKNNIAVTGFGHRVYRTEDPRARHMRDGVKQLSEELGHTQWFEILQAVVEAMKPYARFGVHVNVDFYAGVAYYLNGIAPDMFVPLFAMGRMPGWAAQCMEQRKSNILIRPLTEYNGPAPRDFTRLEDRT